MGGKDNGDQNGDEQTSEPGPDASRQAPEPPTHKDVGDKQHWH